MSFYGNRNIAEGKPPDSFTATTVSAEMVPEDIDRKGLVLTNVGNQNVWLGFGIHDAEVDKGVRLVKNQSIAWVSDLLPIQAVSVITSISSSAVLIQEFN